MSNGLTCGCRSASSLSSGPSRTQRESFQTPTSRLPLSRKPTPPNIFFSSMLFLRARAPRMRVARDSSKAIVLVLHQRGPVVLAEHVSPSGHHRHHVEDVQPKRLVARDPNAG